MQIGDVVIQCAIVLQRVGRAICIIEEVQGIAAVGFPEQLAAGIEVCVLDPVHSFGGADSVSIVGKTQILRAAGGGFQPFALAPGEGPAGTVVVAEGVTDSIYLNYTSFQPTPQEKKPWNHEDPRALGWVLVMVYLPERHKYLRTLKYMILCFRLQ